MSQPAKWRDDPPTQSPEMRRSLVTRRRVLGLLMAAILLAGVIGLMIFGVRPMPHARFVPLWITEYQSPALPPRTFAEHDRDAFREGGYFGRAIPREEAALETETLLQKLAALRSISTHEPVVLYLSAYARTTKAGQVEVLPANADPVQDRNGLALRDVLEFLVKCPSRHKLLILDVMDPLHDGRLGLIADDVPTAVQEDLKQVPDAARLVLLSCSPGQTSLYAEEQRRSVFSYYLEAGLRGSADGFNANGDRDGQIGARELAEFVRARVDRWSWRNRRVHQTPQLLGEDGDFALLALEHRQVKPPVPIPDAEKYPEWLREAWKARQRWWTDDSYRQAPQLFRQLETTLLAVESDWRQGVDPERLQESLKASLVRFEQKLKKAVVPDLAKPPSLALAEKGHAPKEETVEAIAREMAAVSTKPHTAADKPGPKPSDDLVASLAKLPLPDLLQAAFEAAANDPRPQPERLRWLSLVIQGRQPEPQFVETLFLERLIDLAERTGPDKWPADTVRQALEVVRLGERVSSQPQVFPWIHEQLEEGAQRRYEGELLLFAGSGYAPPRETARRLQLAAERYETAQRRADTVAAMQRLLDEAFAFLPAYAPYLEYMPEQEAAWLDAVASCIKLADLLAAQAEDLSGAAQPMTQLAGDLSRLRQPFGVDAIAALQSRLTHKNAPPTAVNEAEAILATPFLSPAERESLWQSARGLARRLHKETVQLDQDDMNQKPVLLETVEGTRVKTTERRRALQRARISTALLRLGGLPADDLRKLDEEWQQASEAINSDSGSIAAWTLGASLRQMWTQRVPELLRPGENVSLRDRLSRVYLPFDPSAVLEDAAPLPQTELRADRQRELLTWRADRNRYEGRELASLELLSDRGLRFYSRAAASYQTQAALLPREPSCQISSDPPLVWLTPSTTRAAATLAFRGIPALAGETDLPVRLLLPSTHWLQITPGLPNAADLDDNTLLRLPRGEPALPLTIRLKPNAEGPPPQGLFVETPCGQRTLHYRLPISLDAISDRIEILLSANPREPAAPLDELRLRPIKSRQPYFLYLRNPSAKPRRVLVQLATTQGGLPGGEAKVELGPNETKQVRFTAPSAPSPPASAAPSPAPAEAAFTEFSGDLQVRLLDLDKANQLIDVRSFRVQIAAPADYTKVTNIQFTPPTQRDRSLGGGRNRLSVTLQATPALIGPPCPVELILPPARIPGLIGVKSGTMRGELKPNESVTLYAENLQFIDGVPEDGYVYVAVDGDERAYVFRTTFARLGEPTSPRQDLLPALRLSAKRFASSGTAPAVTLEVDRAPSGATVELSLGRYRDGVFESEADYKRPTAKRQRIACGPVSPDGALLFEASTSDWVIQPDTNKVVGPRIFLRGRLLDQGSVPIRTVYETLTLDDSPPQGIRFVDPPKVAKKDAPLTLQATAGTSVSGVSEVAFFLGKDVQGKPPQGAALIPGRPLDDAKTTWTATIPLRVEKAGPTEFTVQFVNRAGQSAFATTTIDLIDADPAKVLPGRIEGIVVEGANPQPGLTVSLRDEKNVEKLTTKTNENGAFSFEKLTPGKYLIYTVKPSNKRQGGTAAVVVAEKTTTLPPIKLYKP